MDRDSKSSKGDSNENFASINALTRENSTKSNAIEIPSIALPKGGGALKGIDEKFKVNAANGTASFSIPLPLSPGRNGLSPELALSYNSGAGNSPFGLGWNVNASMIQRKTDKGIPRYKKGEEEDVFTFSGGEDLIPYLDDKDHWHPIEKEINGTVIRRFRPRLEGGFSRIEQITGKTGGQVYWKITTKENTVTFFGLSKNARLFDPQDDSRIFTWLPEFSYDDKGNWIRYEYKAENLVNVPDLVHEKNRLNGLAKFTNRYLKRIKYGNRKPWYADDPFDPSLPGPEEEYLFEVVLDYGDHKNLDNAEQTPAYEEIRSWESRPDAFSSYRSGFEIRTYRNCHNILLFHHFPEERQFQGSGDEEVFGKNYLVKSLALSYQASGINGSGQTEVSYLKSIIQKGFIRKGEIYFEKNLPALEFEYQQLQWNTETRTVDRESTVNAPVGLTNNYQWVDLYGEGLNGILTEQAEGWYYKSNLGDLEESHQVRFAPAKEVISKPSYSGLSSGLLSIQDLEANGEKQVVVNSSGMQGYFELDSGNDFKPFRAFENIANINLQDPHTRLLDLNGDGQPDMVMTDESVFRWYSSNGKKGYQPAKFTLKPFDEELGPALVFADTHHQEAIFLADMDGDGLTDIVRVRNGEICYWANKGYGEFSAKINMGNAPLFDLPEQFNLKYLQLADISGTGASDIIYLGKNKFKAYINLTGNAWSEAHEIEPFFPIDSNTQVSVVDLLGTGTSCIVWSSDLPAESHAPMRYMDLMDSKKPHVLKKQINNMGKETRMEYKSSTYFYLKDQQADKPWITKLPFPVHVISKTIVEDKISDVRFTTAYRYHHGYYDHPEREFRGFGMVEQLDTEEYEDWSSNNAGNQLEKSKALYQAPMLTKSWFHTGAFLDREQILRQFEEEYWFKRYNEAFPEVRITTAEPELEDAQITTNSTLEGVFDISLLSAEEHREALRACKGMMLRQEVFAMDAPSESPTPEDLQKERKPYTVATHNCQIQLLQPRLGNRYASFIVTESEAIAISYERDETDPRIAHTLNVKLDEIGNVLEAASVVYPRINPNVDLPAEVRQKQDATLIAYTRSSFTEDKIGDSLYKLRQPSEVETFEITGLTKANDLYEFSDFKDILKINSEEIAYNETQTEGTTQRRPIEYIRSLYYNEELTGALPVGKLGSHGIPYESYQLAYTPELLSTLFGNKISDPNTLLRDEGKFVHSEGDNNWWIRSGRPLFIKTEEDDITSVRSRFYSPIGYLSPFDSRTTVSYYKDYYLFLQATEDALGNRVDTERLNFRTLSPIRMRDINDNISEVLVDELGLPKAMAILGKGEEADQLDGLTEFTLETERNDIQDYFTVSDTVLLRASARDLLKGATTRFVYDFNRYQSSVLLSKEQLEGNPETELCARSKLLPTVTGSILREQHDQVNSESPLQLSFEYSDGTGNVAMAKTQAEPGEALKLEVEANCEYTLETVDTGDQLRWLGNGRTVLNNKGKPVKQYEPYFSVNPFYEDNKELVERGVTPIMYYDAVGRNICMELPDGTFTKVIFDSWQQSNFDQNDTVKDSQWYDERINSRIDAKLVAVGKDPVKEKSAAEKAAKHYDTPSVVHLDTLGRPVLSTAHNRIEEKDAGVNVIHIKEQFYDTFIDLDIEGNVQKVVDARGNTVMKYGYDMLGNRVYQNSMDAGEKWNLNNVAGNPIRGWDSRDHLFTSSYDLLQRPLEKGVRLLSGVTGIQIVEKIVYGESQPDAKANNLRGQAFEHYDSSGRLKNLRFDFQGNLLETQRQLAIAYRNEVVDWSDGLTANALEEETFTLITEYDALSRMRRLYNWHRNEERVTVYEPTYNERGLLKEEDHITAAKRHGNSYSGGRRITAVSGMQYDEKAQRLRIRYGNGTTTRYHYDPQTFRLSQLRTIKGGTTTTLPSLRSNLSNPNILQNLYYTYDPVGNITEIEDDAYEPVFFNNQQVEPKSHYTYDSLYRLIRAEGRENKTFDRAPGPKDNAAISVNSFPIADQALRNYTQNYQYDSVGNLLQMRHISSGERWTRSYSYASDSNRMLRSWNGSDTTKAVDYAYDQHGNMLNYNNMPEEFRPQWDYQDRVHAIDLGGGGKAYYQYGADLERSRKRIEQRGNSTEERLYLGGMEVYRRWNGDTLVEEIETQQLMVEDQRVLMVEEVIQSDSNHLNTGILDRYQYCNHLGSVGLELDGGGNIISYEEYHPYGTLAYQAKNSAIKASAKRYRYTGMERDEESGLNYHSARYYLPWLGRWLSADPIGIGDGVNVYIYVSNNPIGKLDSKGTEGKEFMYDIRLSTTITYGSSNIEVTHSLSAYLSGVFDSGIGGEVGGKVELYHSDKKYGIDLPARGINTSVFAGVGFSSSANNEINRSDSYNIRTFSGSGPSLLDNKFGLGHTVFEGRFIDKDNSSSEEELRLFSTIASVYGSLKIGDDSLRLVYGNDNMFFGNRLDANETANLSVFYKRNSLELELGFFNVTDQINHVASESELNPEMATMSEDPAGYRLAGGEMWDESRKLGTYQTYGQGIMQHVLFLGIQDESQHFQIGTSGKYGHDWTQGAIHDFLGYHLFPHKKSNSFHFEYNRN